MTFPFLGDVCFNSIEYSSCGPQLVNYIDAAGVNTDVLCIELFLTHSVFIATKEK